MTFSKSVEKRIEAQTGEKLFTQQEVDALVAAALALFVQKAADIAQAHDEGTHDCRNWIRTELCGQVIAQEILALADPLALGKHDAALREKYEVELANLRGRLHTIGMAGEFGASNSKVVERLRELEDTNYAARQYIQNAKEREATNAKLEVENAELRMCIESWKKEELLWREQIATAERRGRLEEAKWQKDNWTGFRETVTKRIAELEAAGPEGSKG